MKILLIGAGGYVGSAVADQLTLAGHTVVELRRTPGGEGTARERRLGDLTDPASLTAAVTEDVDAVIDAAAPTGDAAADRAAVDALLAPLRGTGRALVHTSGVWVLGATGPEPVDEAAATDPPAIVAHRPGIERRVLAAAADGVRAAVIRPGIVHGRGGGIPALLVRLAREHGAPRLVGEGGVRWPMVHVEDLAALFVDVVDRAEAGTLWHGVSQPAVDVAELTAAAGRAAGVFTEPVPWPVAQAGAELGVPFAEALALDQAVSGEAARARLGWTPAGPDAVTDLRAGSYREIAVFGAEQTGPDEVAAIVRLVAEVEAAQRAERPDAFMRLFRTADPVWTTAHGKRLSGWETISDFTHRVLPGAMRHGAAAYEVERILFVRPDVAVVNVRQAPIHLDGTPSDAAPEGRPCYVLAREGGVWRIAAAQNTQVHSGS